MTGHTSPLSHYRHMGQLRTSRVASRSWKGVTLSGILRTMSLALVPVAAIAYIVAAGPAPSANATPCGAPDANIEPPPGQPAMPAPQPVVQPPTGRRPSHTNDQAPLPKLGPLIASLIKPPAGGGQRYSAPMVPQAGGGA